MMHYTPVTEWRSHDLHGVELSAKRIEYLPFADIPLGFSLRTIRFRFQVTINDDKLSVDLSVLASLRDFQQAGEPDFVTELIDLFLRDTIWQLELVRTAVANNEVNEFRRLAHLVKGSSGNIGAKQLATLCDAMENNELPNGAAGSLLLELENEFELVSSLLNAERQGSWAPLNAPRG